MRAEGDSGLGIEGWDDIGAEGDSGLGVSEGHGGLKNREGFL